MDFDLFFTATHNSSWGSVVGTYLILAALVWFCFHLALASVKKSWKLGKDKSRSSVLDLYQFVIFLLILGTIIGFVFQSFYLDTVCPDMTDNLNIIEHIQYYSQDDVELCQYLADKNKQ